MLDRGDRAGRDDDGAGFGAAGSRIVRRFSRWGGGPARLAGGESDGGKRGGRGGVGNLHERAGLEIPRGNDGGVGRRDGEIPARGGGRDGGFLETNGRSPRLPRGGRRSADAGGAGKRGDGFAGGIRGISRPCAEGGGPVDFRRGGRGPALRRLACRAVR